MAFVHSVYPGKHYKVSSLHDHDESAIEAVLDVIESPGAIPVQVTLKYDPHLSPNNLACWACVIELANGNSLELDGRTLVVMAHERAWPGAFVRMCDDLDGSRRWGPIFINPASYMASNGLPQAYTLSSAPSAVDKFDPVLDPRLNPEPADLLFAAIPIATIFRVWLANIRGHVIYWSLKYDPKDPSAGVLILEMTGHQWGHNHYFRCNVGVVQEALSMSLFPVNWLADIALRCQQTGLKRFEDVILQGESINQVLARSTMGKSMNFDNSDNPDKVRELAIAQMTKAFHDLSQAQGQALAKAIGDVSIDLKVDPKLSADLNRLKSDLKEAHKSEPDDLGDVIRQARQDASKRAQAQAKQDPSLSLKDLPSLVKHYRLQGRQVVEVEPGHRPYPDNKPLALSELQCYERSAEILTVTIETTLVTPCPYEAGITPEPLITTVRARGRYTGIEFERFDRTADNWARAMANHSIAKAGVRAELARLAPTVAGAVIGVYDEGD